MRNFRRGFGKKCLVCVCTAVLLMAMVGYCCLWSVVKTIHGMHLRVVGSSITVKVEPFPLWTTSDPHDSTFIRRVYVYSAIVVIHNTPPGATDIHLVTFHDGRTPSLLRCCLRSKDGTIQAQPQPASEDFVYYNPTVNAFDRTVIGVVYACSFSGLSKKEASESWVTLASELCPQDVKEYTKVEVPEDKPEDIAVCAKITYGYLLDPHRLVEWFEMQRLQGVNRIQLFALTNPEPLKSVFKYYQDMGLLDLLPYKLPGRPWNRSLLQGWEDPKVQYTLLYDDETLPVWECRLRLAGHKYVMGYDLDELIMPKRSLKLKPYFEEQFREHPQAGSLFFKVQFFLDSWDKVDPKAPLKFLQYLNSTEPFWGAQKYVYIPRRIKQATTHNVFNRPEYSKYIVPTTEATLFHYRACPLSWETCDLKQIKDVSMLGYKEDLIPAVAAAKKKINL